MGDMLWRAREGQEARVTQLRGKLRLTSTALSAVNPKFMGKYHKGEILPLVLGSTHSQVNVDFAPLIETLVRPRPVPHSVQPTLAAQPAQPALAAQSTLESQPLLSLLRGAA